MSATFAEPQADGSVKLRAPLGSGDWLTLGTVSPDRLHCVVCRAPIVVEERFRMTDGTRVGAIYNHEGSGVFELAHRDSKVCDQESLSHLLTT